MIKYSEIYSEGELIKLRNGLEILERSVDINIWLYGVVTDPDILTVAKEAIISIDEDFLNEEGKTTLKDNDIELDEIAISIPISSSTIDILYSSGYPLHKLDFVYQYGEGNGIRTLGFYNASTTSTMIKIGNIDTKAIAGSDLYLDEFLKDKGNGATMEINRKVQRNEEATKKVPRVSEPSKLKTPESTGTMPHASSLKVKKISDIVEEFLG